MLEQKNGTLKHIFTIEARSTTILINKIHVASMTIGRKGRKHEETKKKDEQYENQKKTQDMEVNLTQTNTNDEQWLEWL